MEIIAKQSYEHYNRALNKHIKSKRHYIDEMKRQGMVSQEEGAEIAQKARERDRKEYKPTKDYLNFVNSVKDRADKDGKVKLSGRQLEYMDKRGLLKRPEYKGLEGGFSAVP